MKTIVIIVMIISIAIQLSAQWSDDTSVNTSVCNADAYQYLSSHGWSKYYIYRTILDGFGGLLVCWYDRRDGNYDIYVQRFDSSGYALWTDNGVPVCTEASTQNSPTMISDGSGGAIICWADGRGTADIYAQKVDSDGNVQWTADGIAVCNATSYQYKPVIVSDGSTGALICWYDKRNGNYDIYAQRIDSSGTTQWVSDLQLSAITSDDWEPMMIEDGIGGAIITWRADDNRVYAQRISNSGTTYWEQIPGRGDPIYVSQGYATPRQDPVMTTDGSGGAIIAWRAGSTVGANYIYAQRVNSGVAQWTSDAKLGDHGGSYSQGNPTICSDGYGGAIACWEDYRNSDWDIYAQRVDGSGSLLWDATGVEVCTETGSQYDPTVVADGNGGAIICWHDYRTPGDDNIYAQRLIGGTGSGFWGTNGAVVCDASRDQNWPMLASDEAGGAIIVWDDFRNNTSSTRDLYTNRITSCGEFCSANAQSVTVTGAYSFTDTATEMDFSTLSGTGSVTVNLVNDSPPGIVAANSADIYWEIQESDISSFETDITFNYAGHIGSLDENSLKIFRNDGSGWSEWPDITRDALNDEITANGVTDFSDWGLGDDDFPLPVTLSSFTAVFSNGSSLLNWTTQSELNNSGWNIYRANTGNFYYSYLLNDQLIEGFGTTAEQHQYSFEDANEIENGNTYYYWLESVEYSGNTELFGPISLIIEINPDNPIPPSAIITGLHQNYPNPFNPETEIIFALEEPGNAELSIYNIKGQKVITLYDSYSLANKYIPVHWDGKDLQKKDVSSGTYLYKLKTDNKAYMKKMLLMK